MSRMTTPCSLCGSDEWHVPRSFVCNQRSRESELKAAEQRGAQRERAAVVTYLIGCPRYQSANTAAADIEAGKHREEDE